MTARDRWIDKHLWRLRCGQFLQRAVEWVGAYLLLFGVMVFLVRRMAPWLWPHVLWLAAGVVPMTVLAWWMSRAGRFNREESVALLDQSLGAGGLLMALTEVPDPEWELRLPQAEAQWQMSLPRFRADRFANFVLPPLVFAVAVCFVPLKKIEAGARKANTAGQQATAELEGLLNTLEEAHVLDEQEQQSLKAAIADLQEETASAPLTHEKWETVDALKQRMQLRLGEAAMDAVTAAGSAALLAQSAGGEGAPLSAERREELEQELVETLRKLSESGALEAALRTASPGLSSELQRLIKSGQLKLPDDAATRQQTLDELAEFLDQEAQKLTELREQSQAGTCRRCGSPCDGEGHCQNGACQSGQCTSCGEPCSDGQCATCLGGSRPGRGGVSRGRADAELTWGEESDGRETKFRETVLPPGLQDQPKDEVLGVTPLAPEVAPATSQTRNAVRGDDPTAGRETWNRTLRPRHRGVVRKFFDQPTE